MRILRGVGLRSKLIMFLVLSLSTASLVTVSAPRPASAEGPLTNTVRCLVRTVLLTSCSPIWTPAPTAPPAAPVAPSPQPPSPEPQPTAPASPGVSSGQTAQVAPRQGIQGDIAQGGAALEPIEMPEEIIAKPEEIKPPVPTYGTNNRIQESDYVAYFNKYSPYAVAGAKQQASVAEVPLERSAEGWRILGVAWYWWAIVAVAIVAAIPTARQKILRNISVLSKSQ